MRNVEGIHIVAHSMGNKVLQRALHNNQEALGKLKSVTFAAPDVNRADFRDMLGVLEGAPPDTPALTLYCSRLDWALWASTALRLVLGNNEGRAGYYQWWLGFHHVLKRHKYHVLLDKQLQTVVVTG